MNAPLLASLLALILTFVTVACDDDSPDGSTDTGSRVDPGPDIDAGPDEIDMNIEDALERDQATPDLDPGDVPVSDGPIELDADADGAADGTPDEIGADAPDVFDELWAAYDLPDFDADSAIDVRAATPDAVISGDIRSDFYDIIFSGTGFGAWNGLRMHVRMNGTSFDGGGVVEASVVIGRGRFGWRWRDVFNPDLFGTMIDYYIDVDGNGSCNSEPAWSAFVSNNFDDEAQLIRVDVEGGDEVATFVCDEW